MLVDLHTKSAATAGVKANVEQVLERAKAVGLDAVAFADTLASAHCQSIIDAAEEAGIKAFIGVEIPSDKGILIGFAPNIDAFYIAEEWRQLTELTTPPAAQVIQLFDELGGAVIAARPYDLSIPYNMGDLIFTLDNIHGVEVFNTRCAQVQCDFAMEAARFMGVPTCGGSDAKDGTDAMGRYATFFPSDIESQQDFVNALRAGEFWAVQFGATPKAKRAPRDDDDDRGGRGRGGRGGRDGGRGRGGRGGGRNGKDRGGRDGGRGGRGGGRGGRGGRGRGDKRD